LIRYYYYNLTFYEDGKVEQTSINSSNGWKIFSESYNYTIENGKIFITPITYEGSWINSSLPPSCIDYKFSDNYNRLTFTVPSEITTEEWNILNSTRMIVGIGIASDPPRISFSEIGFTDHDIEEMKKLPDVKEATPLSLLPLKEFREGFLNESKAGGAMYATTPDLLDTMDLKIKEGRMFQDGKKEIVINESMTRIFGEDKQLKVGDIIYIYRIGDTLPINSTIVGILKENQNASALSQFTSISIAGPVDPYYSTYFGSNVGGILKHITAYGILSVIATDKDHVNNVENEILNYLNTNSDAINYKGKNSDFVVITQQYTIPNAVYEKQ